MRPTFIHIPKCGGMSVRHGLKSKIITAGRNQHRSVEYSDQLLSAMDADGEHHGYEHARWRDLHPNYQRHCFAMVRNPWARVVSRYTFARINNDPSGSKSFREFLEERWEYADRQYYWHRGIRGWYPQVDYVTDRDGQLRVDCLRLGTDDIERYFKLDAPLPKRNVSNVRGVDYRTLYNGETREIVEEWYCDDIEFFGFNFDGHATRNIWTPTS